MDYTFNLPEGLVTSPLFKHRALPTWLNDAIRSAGLAPDGDWGSTADYRKLQVHGFTEPMLRLTCVLLNQHAEQSPCDPTPRDEAARLEAFLAEPRVTIGEAFKVLRDCLGLAEGDEENVPTPQYNAAHRLLEYLSIQPDDSITVREFVGDR